MQFKSIILSIALSVACVSAQDDGAGFFFKCDAPGTVALTFDDGPSDFTPELLTTLKTAEIPATFFVLGKSINAGQGKAALKAAFDAGHQIALHSNTHADMNTLTAKAIQSEYELNIKAVEDTIGVRPKMARPPYGNCNANCAKVLTGTMGLSIIQWNCDSNDWQYEGKVNEYGKVYTNMEAIINPSNPKTDSFITLQHDIKDYSVQMTPKIIDMIKAKGYQFVTVEQCLSGKIPAYDGKAAATKAPAQTTAKAPLKAPQPEAQPETPSETPKIVEGPAPENEVPVANAEEKSDKVVANSAEKLSSIFGFTLIGLISGLLMY
ncbi:3814_t:CDS:2 [Funneliformis caledonium]|uniref:3814_t:CDS:1 n=1 Tax=Funneliformis caledonium TaxID=1117310 RepID=A0A9N9GU99_9GLOM|nr:3814_t:CDS:2 [Funneliformis caledonium]